MRLQLDNRRQAKINLGYNFSGKLIMGPLIITTIFPGKLATNINNINVIIFLFYLYKGSIISATRPHRHVAFLDKPISGPIEP